MASRTPDARVSRPGSLPDLPRSGSGEARHGPIRMPRSNAPPGTRSSRPDRHQTDRLATSKRSRHARTGLSASGESAMSRASHARALAWSWLPPVLPRPRQIVQEAVPNALMAFSSLAVVWIATFAPMGVPLWAAGIFLPTVLLAWLANATLHPHWRRTSLVNLATMAAVFPALVVRQSVLRIPFVEGGNGTLLAPTIATLAVIVVLILLAAGSAVLSQEDPEYAGVVFLPAALMVPFLAGQTELLSLRGGLLICAGIFFAGGILTIIASMLPGAYPALIAPMAIAAEFILLTLVRETSIFPIGAGIAAKILFFIVVIVTVGLSILVPLLSQWIRQVTRIAQVQTRAK